MENNLSKLKKFCEKKKIDGYILTTFDEYLNEYVPETKKRIKFLTNFSGSNGIFFFINKVFLFFTDGRYLIQAKKELPKNFKIFDIAKKNIFEWIDEKLKYQKYKIQLDSRINKIAFVERLSQTFKETKSKLIIGNSILVDQIIKKETKIITSKAFFLPKKYTGFSAKFKIKMLKKKLVGFDCLVITSPESVSWLLNIRGFDLMFTPLVLCRMIISIKGKDQLFINKTKMNKTSLKRLNKLGIQVIEEDNIDIEIKKISKNNKVLMDKDSPFYFCDLLKMNNLNFTLGIDPCKRLKAIKNDIEISNSKRIHIIDGVALVKFFYWLSTKAQKNSFNEFEISKKLEQFRNQNTEFKSLSFPTISAVGSNGAIIHYEPNKYDSKRLTQGKLFLCDSGAQYFGGTTDVTRTVLIGDKCYTNKIKEHYTNVLTGHINISMAKFPMNTSGGQLDAMGRYALWQRGLDYNHGTGHGVGSYLSVHEGPQSISKSTINEPLKKGMIISNEPGYYREGSFGIRIENLIFVKDSKYENFLEFETLTMFPYERDLIDLSKLSRTHIDWLNKYHKSVFQNLKKFLDTDTRKWLFEKTLPI